MQYSVKRERIKIIKQFVVLNKLQTIRITNHRIHSTSKTTLTESTACPKNNRAVNARVEYLSLSVEYALQIGCWTE